MENHSHALADSAVATSHLTTIQFADLPLNAAVLQGLTSDGFQYCTPIQAESLRYSLNNQDVAGQGQTGTGKTIAFLTTVCHHLLTHPTPESRLKQNPRALILTPVRDLVNQIEDNAKSLAKATGLKFAKASGGESYEDQIKQITNGCDVLIATPGRLIDYLKQSIFSLDSIQAVVIDEADRMFDDGFIKDIRWTLKKCPKDRLTLLFSATLSHNVRELAFEYMHDPIYVEVEPEQKIAPKIHEELFFPSNDDKLALLQTLIEEEWPDRAIIFTNTKNSAEHIFRHLQADKLRVGLLTGDVAQNKRNSTIERFTNGDLDLLVATNVAARGLHIPNITHVFNYDLPDDFNDYLHRIGRTGRAGAEGSSISFACEKYAHNLSAIETAIGHSIPISHYKPEVLLKDLPKPVYHKPPFKKTSKPFVKPRSR